MAVEVLFLPLEKILEYFKNNRWRREDRIEKAIDAISEALNASLQYVEQSRGQKGTDRDIEFSLARLWAKASISCLFIAPELSLQLHTKEEYWQDHLEWSDEAINTSKISFDHIKAELQKLRPA
jgi:hypothetical protein